MTTAKETPTPLDEPEFGAGLEADLGFDTDEDLGVEMDLEVASGVASTEAPEPTVEDFFDSWELFSEAVASGTWAGALLGFLGVYVVLRRMAFLSVALSQSASLGVTLAFFAQARWALTGWWVSARSGAVVATLAVAFGLVGDRAATTRRDSLLGLIYLLGAAGTLALGGFIAQDLPDLRALLFGISVAVLPEDRVTIEWMSIGLLSLHVWWMRGVIESVFDPDGARVRGIPVRALQGFLLVSLAIAIAICTQILGALPVFAYSVLPAMAAVRLAPNIPSALIAATLIGAASGFLGYLFAFLYGLPVPATQTLVAVSAVLIAELLRWGIYAVRFFSRR